MPRPFLIGDRSGKGIGPVEAEVVRGEATDVAVERRKWPPVNGRLQPKREQKPIPVVETI
jgi:hypothetical protein